MVKLELSRVQIVIIIVVAVVIFFLITRCQLRCYRGENFIRTTLPQIAPGLVACGSPTCPCPPSQCQFSRGLGTIKPPIYTVCTDSNPYEEL